jgi:serine phosphatase RsbU (regulator of sigma subunit)
MAQPAATLSISGRTSLIIALIVLAVEIIFLFKGKLYREDEVRPIYAKHLAERLSMQAEVSAAREAQRRLMPNHLPRSDYFSVAASFLPAFEVGGDYYDVFELEPGKLGVLIAEGGGKGLGSALSIAFAKGFLMPKILHQGGGDDSPTEIIRGLQDRLQTKLEEEGSVGLAYAVIDAADGAVRYARTGSHPSIIIARGQTTPKLLNPEERVLNFKSNLRAEAEVSITEASFSLQPGDSIVFFTDGIAKDWGNNGASPEVEIGKIISESNRGNSDHLQQTLTKSVNDCLKRARKRGIEDDLTAVVVRFDGLEPAVEIDDREEKAAR